MRAHTPHRTLTLARTFAWATAISLATAAGRPAHAAPEASRDGVDPASSTAAAIALLPLIVHGSSPAMRLSELRETVIDALRRSGWTVIPSTDPEPCPIPNPQCAATRARGVAAPHAISIEITIDRRDFRLAWSVIDAQTAEVVAESQELCEVCGFSEVLAVADHQAAAIATRLDALSLEAPTLRFESVPPGAVIEIDGRAVGRTPLERVVAVGPHELRAMLDHFVDERRRIEAVAGVRQTISFHLDRAPGETKRHPATIAGWSLLGGGLATLAAGIPLIVLDGRQNRLQCDGDDVDPRGQCRYLYATLEAGIAMVTVGAAAVVASAALLVVFRRQGPHRTSLRAHPRGLVLEGRF